MRTWKWQLMLWILFILLPSWTGCGTVTAPETAEESNRLEADPAEGYTQRPTDPYVREVRFVSGTTFSGKLRPLVLPNGQQILDAAPISSAKAVPGKRIYTVNNTKAGKIWGIQEQSDNYRDVEAVSRLGYRFVSWDDGWTEATRLDKQDGLYTAIFDYDMQGMPILVIQTEAPVESKEEYTPGSLSLYGCADKYVRTDIQMEIRGRGNNSWTYPKKSYKIKLEQKDNLLGLAGGKERTWCLLANQCDLSLQRNRVALELCQYMDGLDWSPACTPVEVYWNGEYVGVYLLTEEIKVSSDRVDVADTDPDAIDTGYLVEMSNYAKGDAVFHAANRAYMIHSDLSEQPEIREAQISFIRKYISQAHKALLSGTREEAAAYIDLDSLVAAYLVEETVENLDSQWDSFYLHKDAGGKLVIGPIWDFDLSMGNADDGSEDPVGIFVGNGRGSGNSESSWFAAAMAHAWFREMVAEAWMERYDSIVQMPLFIWDEAQLGAASYARNFIKWDIFGQKQNRETPQVVRLSSFEAHTEYLVQFLEKRIAWLDALFRDPAFVTQGKGIDNCIS